MIATILVLTSLVGILTLPHFALLRRRALYQSRALMSAYRAPMVGCERTGVIEGSYFVFLHCGCSLDKHNQTIGNNVDITSKIRRVYPETPGHGLYYWAEDIDETALEAIRSDIVVDMIECNRALDMSDGVEDVEIIHSEDL